MKKARLLILSVFIFPIMLTSCASSTMITSSPSGAKVYVDGNLKGTTPYKHKDRKPSLSQTQVGVEKLGYEGEYASITKDDDVHLGAAVGGFFLILPWAWILEYDENYHFELSPHGPEHPEHELFHATRPKTKVEKLLELKALMDQGILTQEEFEREKKKVLEEDE